MCIRDSLIADTNLQTLLDFKFNREIFAKAGFKGGPNKRSGATGDNTLLIVHGIGTGKLKKGLRIWLSGLNYVDKVEEAANNEGGAGCSIAWIK